MQERESEVRRFKVREDRDREYTVIETVIVSSSRDANGTLHASTGASLFRVADPVLVMGLLQESEPVNKIERASFRSSGPDSFFGRLDTGTVVQ